MRFTVAIDGPAGAGKGTVARALATKFGFAHLDTGMLYRAVGRRTLDEGRGTLDEGLAELVARGLTADDLARTDLRSAMASRAASRVAAMPRVRAALLDYQRAFAEREGGAVLDGRDIGTVICPGADVKLFVTASPEVRARRRFAELEAAGAETTLARVLADMTDRDARDSARADAPLTAAADSVELDTDGMTIEEAVAAAERIVDGRLAPR